MHPQRFVVYSGYLAQDLRFTGSNPAKRQGLGLTGNAGSKAFGIF
jgi:hypothetical protein